MTPAHMLRLRRLPHGEGLPLPAHATLGAAGLDLSAAVVEPVVLCPGEREAIPTGFCLELPPGVEAQVRPRSGLALKKGLTVLNTPGTVDPDYRGEVKVILINLGDTTVVIQRGDRIAQMVLAHFLPTTCIEAETISETERGSAGFGSTGVAGA